MSELIEFEATCDGFKSLSDRVGGGYRLWLLVPEAHMEKVAFIHKTWKKRSIKFAAEPTTEPLGEHAD